MKKLFFLFLLIAEISSAQVNKLPRYNPATSTAPDSVLYQVYDSTQHYNASSHIYKITFGKLKTLIGGGGGGGTVTSVATGVGLTGGTITTTGTLKIDTTYYGTASKSGLLKYSDWILFNAKGNGTVTSIANGYGILGGTITTTGTLRVDSSKVATRYYVGANFYPLTGNPSGFGTGTVTSVSGTSSRITSTGGTTPVIDISGSYVGQSSITTLGTIGTGIWQGTAIGATYGGTGINTSASTGVAQVSSGTWSISTGLASGTTAVNQIANTDNTTVANTHYSDLSAKGNQVKTYQALGGAAISQSAGMNVNQITTSTVLQNQSMQIIALDYLNATTTITGIKWYQAAIGSYTANNNNRWGLYSYSGGTCTLVASCTNDGTLWQTASTNTWGIKAASATYSAAPGQYFIGLLYCRSAVVTAPSIGLTPNSSNAAIQSFDFTNSAKLQGLLTGQTDLPSSFAMSSVTAVVNNFYVIIY